MTASPANANLFANIKAQLQQHDPTDIPMWLQTWLIFGEYGSGKSTLAAQFEDHVYFDIEHGAQNIPHTSLPTLKNTWASFDEFVEQLWQIAKSGEEMPFKTLIIDTAGDLVDLCIKHVWAANGWKEAADGERGAGWTAPRAEFKRVVDKLMRMHKGGKLGTVFLAHEDTVEEKVGLTYAANVAVPKIGDKDIATWLPAKCQLVLRAAKTNVNPMNAADVWKERKFILQSSAGESAARIKDRTKRLPAFLPTDYPTLKKAYNSKKEN
jgi:hypothetical protein